MYTYPNSDLHILSGCPLEPSYVNTIYFNSRADQTDYFSTLTKYSFEKYTFLRDRGFIKVYRPVGDLYDCNYLMFRNTAYSNRWFYAFITNVEYDNDTTTRVYFSLDVMQTWFFDYDLQEVFVDREHTSSDKLFENTVPENIGYGELICQKTELRNYPQLKADCYILLASETPEGNKPEVRFLYGQLCPLYPIITRAPTDEGGQGGWKDLQVPLNRYIDTGRTDAVISIYAIPRFMGALPTGEYPEGVSKEQVTFEMPVTDLDGYVPRNKKLFSYPYNVLWVSNNSGSVVEYRYENFEYGNDPQYYRCFFWLYGTAFTTPSVTLVPAGYKQHIFDWDESVSLSAYTPTPFIGDIYAAYMAQNSNKIAYAQSAPVQRGIYNAAVSAYKGVANAAESALTTMATAPVGKHSALSAGGIDTQSQLGMGVFSSLADGVQGAGLSLLGGVFERHMVIQEQLATQEDLQNVPNTARGLMQASSVLQASGELAFYAHKMCIKKEYAVILDDYFDRYGYKCNRMKTPNRNVRPHWTYTKTVGCTITARCPADAEAAICSIYDSGITFWRYGDEVGNYSLDNTL